MAELDLSLSDALTDSIPQPSSEGLVERDFVAQLEEETFDDQVKETVGKTDYVPLLDNDDTRTDAGTTLENGEQEAHGVQKPGFSQPGGMGMEMEAEAVPLNVERPANIVEPQHSCPPAGSVTSMVHSPWVPEPQTPHSPQDLSAGPFSCSSTDPRFTPSVSMMLAKQAGHLAASPEDLHDSWPNRESTAYAGGDERDVDGSDRKQKKKKKRRQKDEGSYEHESRGPPEIQALGEDAPPAEEFYHRIGPRRDRGEGGWEEQLGKSGGRGKRGKNRKKIPEEWAVMAEPFVPSSAATSQITEDVMMDLESSAHANLEPSLASMDSSLKDVNLEEGSVHAPLSQEVFSSAATAMSPLVLNSELKATAAPFTMPSTTSISVGSFPHATPSADQFSLLMDTENANLGHSSQAFCPPFSPENNAAGSDMMDSGMFDSSNSFQEPYVEGMPEGDTSAFSPASQTSLGFSPIDEVLASAPPLSPSDASWLLNNSHMSSKSEPFDLSDVSTSDHPLPLGLSFDTPSPTPLRSPKTTAQEFQPKEHRDAKSTPNQSKKSQSSSSSSSSVKSPTSLEAKKMSPQASPITTPSSPPSVNPLGAPGSGLNPSAKPFFPSFADPMEEPAVVPEVVPIMEVKSDQMEKKEEKLADDVKKVNEPEQKSVKVEYTGTETPAKVEREIEKEKEKDESEKGEEEKQADKMKRSEVDEKETEKVKNLEMEKAELIQERKEKEDNIHKEEKSHVKVDKTEQVAEVEMMNKLENKGEKADTMEKMEKKEKFKVGEKADETEAKKSEVKVDKEQHIDRVEMTPNQQPTPVKLDTSFELMEKKAEAEAKVTSEAEDTKKEKADTEEAKTEDEPSKPEKPAEKVLEKIKKEEKQDEKIAEKKDGKKEKTAKADGAEKDKKPAKPAGSSTALSRGHTSADKKAKTTTEKRPLVPKANTQMGSTKNETATTAASKTATRIAAPARTATAAAAKKPLATKTDSKPGEEKKPSTLRTTTADSTKPKTTTTTRSTTSTTAAPRTRTTAARPAAPSSTTGSVLEKRPTVPHAPRATPATATSVARPGTARPGTARPGTARPGTARPSTARPSTAPGPDIHNARSKIASTDNMKHQPGGGKVSSSSQNKGVSSKETSLGKVQILNKKVDVSKVTSKCGSKDNIKHKPGGGVVKIESHKVNFREKSQSKVGSLDNVSHSAGGGNITAEGAQEAAEGRKTPLSDSLAPAPAPGPEPGQVGSPAAQENGLNDMAPCDSEGLREPQALDSHIPETN